MNNKLINDKKNIALSSIFLQQKKWKFFDFRSDPDPHQNEVDPEHWKERQQPNHFASLAIYNFFFFYH